MALASLRKVFLGCFAFSVFWVLALFPRFHVLPIGRTAGAVLGAALMVVFQVESPKTAYAAIDLPILGLLFGTMVVSVFLQNADMFQYLGNLLSWKSRGGKDLLFRLSFLVALASALFTNDTSCVVFTEFVLKLCRQKNLPPEPFLIALASSANIGSSATPIGNPQNLVIAVQSGIPFGKFLLGILPAMAVGVLVNTVLLLVLYWKQLSRVEGGREPRQGCLAEETMVLKAKATGSPLLGNIKDRLSAERSRSDKTDPCKSETLGRSEQFHRDFPAMLKEEIQFPSLRIIPEHGGDANDSHPSSSHGKGKGNDPIPDFTVNSGSVFENAQDEGKKSAEDNAVSIQLPLELRKSRSESELRRSRLAVSSSTVDILPRKFFYECDSPPPLLIEKDGACEKRKRNIWKAFVYLITAAMLAALLYGLDLSWSALTAAVALMVIDFSDAGPNLDKVAYPILVFFSGMFITVDGFNRTGIPGKFWDAVEPHAHLDNAGGITVLAFVVLILSNFTSNVPTVLLLGKRVAESAAALQSVGTNKAWLMLAWTSTIAGNLTLIGSAANLIVSEQARKSQVLGYHLSFWCHLRFGFVATLIVTAVGIPLIRA